MSRFLFYVISILIFSSEIIFAQGPPINTDTPILLGLEGAGAGGFVKYVSKSQLLKDGKEFDDPNKTKINATIIPFGVPYNVTADLLVGVMLPTMNLSMESIKGKESSSGIGDVMLFAKYTVLQIDKKQETFRIVAKGGVKFPTGNENAKIPLGTGSTDFSFGSASAWIAKRIGLYGELMYALNTKHKEIDHGDIAVYNFAFGYRILPVFYKTYPAKQLNAYIELNGSYSFKTKKGGVEDNNTGGNEIYISPGIQYIPWYRMLIETSFQYPLVEALNGIQIGTDYIFKLGVRVLLF